MKSLRNIACLACSLAAMFVYAEDTTDPSQPQIISNSDIAKFYMSDGTYREEAFGGGFGIGNLFDGNFTTGVIVGPNGRLDNGGYCLLDFTSQFEGPYYITQIKIGCVTTHRYSVYTSTDGVTYTAAPEGANVSAVGTTTFIVNDLASYVKVVYDQIGGWTATISEIEVWGVDPFYIECTHPSYSEWTVVTGTATCTTPGSDECFCTLCGERFTRDSLLTTPLGHDFVAYLEKEGRVIAHGSGYVECSRCKLNYDFPEPINLNTYGGEKFPGIYHLVDISSSSIGNPEWGITLSDIFDGSWNMSWNGYWYSVGNTDEYILYEFGSELDLTSIEMSVSNDGMIVQFYSVDGAAETLINNFKIYKQKLELETVPGVNEDGTETTNVIVSSRTYEEEAEKIIDGRLVIPSDEQIGSITDENNRYNQFRLEFSAQSVKTLKIKLCDDDTIYEEYEMSRPKQFRVCEFVPYGTVKGAGKIPYELTTLILLK